MSEPLTVIINNHLAASLDDLWRGLESNALGAEASEWTQTTESFLEESTWDVQRTLFLYKKPRRLVETMVQYLRRENKRVIMGLNLRRHGVPFADSYRTEVQWLLDGSRVRVSCRVVISEPVLVQSRIRKSELERVRQSQLTVFRSLKKDVMVPLSKSVVSKLPPWLVFWTTSTNDVQLYLRKAWGGLRIVQALPKLQDESTEQVEVVHQHLAIAHEALNAALTRQYEWEAQQPSATPYFQPLRQVWDMVRGTSNVPKTVARETTPVPPDPILDQMTVVWRKSMNGTSVDKIFETCFAEPAFFSSWLQSTGKTNVVVGDWDTTEEWKDDFSQENFTHRRVLSYKYPLDTPAKVEVHQYCRLEPNNQLVLASTVLPQAVPFGSSFRPHVRWTAVRMARRQVLVRVGLHVEMVDSVLVSSKIRAGSTRETTQSQRSLFYSIRTATTNALMSPVPNGGLSRFEFDETDGSRLPDLVACWTSINPFHSASLVEEEEELSMEVHLLERKLDALKTDSLSEDNELTKFLLSQLGVVDEALGSIAQWHVGKYPNPISPEEKVAVY